MAQQSPEPQNKGREQSRQDLIDKALDHPGIREVMQVYEEWRYRDQGLEPHRAIRRASPAITTTDRANLQ